MYIYVRYGFLLVFYSSSVPKTYPFLRYSTGNYSVTSKPGLRLLMDIGTNTYRSDTYDFLLMFHWDYLIPFLR